MPRLSRKLPSYRHHKSDGRAVVTLNGRDVYLGRFGTPESRAEYDRLIAQWLASGRPPPPRPSGPRPGIMAGARPTPPSSRSWSPSSGTPRRTTATPTGRRPTRSGTSRTP